MLKVLLPIISALFVAALPIRSEARADTTFGVVEAGEESSSFSVLSVTNSSGKAIDAALKLYDPIRQTPLRTYRVHQILPGASERILVLHGKELRYFSLTTDGISSDLSVVVEQSGSPSVLKTLHSSTLCGRAHSLRPDASYYILGSSSRSLFGTLVLGKNGAEETLPWNSAATKGIGRPLLPGHLSKLDVLSRSAQLIPSCPTDENSSSETLVEVGTAPSSTSLMSTDSAHADAIIDPGAEFFVFDRLGREIERSLASRTETKIRGRSTRGSHLIFRTTTAATSTRSGEVVTRSLPALNRRPEISYLAPQSVRVNSRLSIYVSAYDPDGDRITFRAANMPLGAQFTEQGFFTWQPSELQIGNHTIYFTASDGRLSTTTQMIVAVTGQGSANRPPVLGTVPDQVVTANSRIGFQLPATDLDGNKLTFRLLSPTLGMEVSSSGYFNWRPTLDQIGLYSVSVAVFDGTVSVTGTFRVRVNPLTQVNRPPILGSVGDQVVTANYRLGLQLPASDPDGDKLTYRLVYPLQGAELSSDGYFNWRPTVQQIGLYTVSVSVSDGKTSVTGSFLIRVNPLTQPNRAPVLGMVEDQVVTANYRIGIQLPATDPDGDKLTFRLVYPIRGAELSTGGYFNWRPTAEQIGVYSVTVSVSDGKTSVTGVFRVSVISQRPPNRAPVLGTVLRQTVTANNRLGLQLPASDPDGDRLTFWFQVPIRGAELSKQGYFNWAPTRDQIGTHAVTVAVSDGTTTVSGTFYVEVIGLQPVNRPPVLSYFRNPSVRVGSSWSIRLSDYANDPDGDPLTYTASYLPANATLDRHTGFFRYAPKGRLEAGVKQITVRVQDSKGAYVHGTFYVTVYN